MRHSVVRNKLNILGPGTIEEKIEFSLVIFYFILFFISSLISLIVEETGVPGEKYNHTNIKDKHGIKSQPLWLMRHFAGK